MAETQYHQLVRLTDNVPAVDVELTKIPNGTLKAFLTLRPEEELYPLDDGLAGITLCWWLSVFPTAATYVQITPIAFRGFIGNPTGVSNAPQLPGFINTGGGATFEFYKFQFDKLDTTSGLVTTFPYTIRKTAVDGTATFGGQTFRKGTRHSIPGSDPYLGFLVETDGTDDSGQQTLWLGLSWGD